MASTAQIISLAIDRISENVIDSRQLSLLHALVELRTLRINLGRGAGHTSYIKHNSGKDDLIVCRDSHLARYHYGDLPQSRKVMSILTEQPHRPIYDFRGCRFQKVWIDMSGKDLNIFYTLNELIMAGCLDKKSIIICLG